MGIELLENNFLVANTEIVEEDMVQPLDLVVLDHPFYNYPSCVGVVVLVALVAPDNFVVEFVVLDHYLEAVQVMSFPMHCLPLETVVDQVVDLYCLIDFEVARQVAVVN